MFSEELEEAAKSIVDAQVANLCLVTSKSHILLFNGQKVLRLVENIQAARQSLALEKLYELQKEVEEKYALFYRNFLAIGNQDKSQAVFLSDKLNRLFTLLTSKAEDVATDREFFFRSTPVARTWSPRDVFMYRKRVHDIEQSDPESINLLKSFGQGIKEGYVAQAIRTNFVGLLTITKPNTWNMCEDKDVMLVSLAAAEKGWGPLVYDIALSIVYPKFLTSSRDDVSKHARKVWDYYLKSRSDIEHVSMADLVKNGKCNIPDLQEVNDTLDEAKARYDILKAEFAKHAGVENPEIAELRKDLEAAAAEYRRAIVAKNELIEKSSSVYKFRIKNPITNTQQLEQNTANFLKELNDATGLKFRQENLAAAGEEYFWKKYETRRD